jgi:hypothetical protein
MVRRRWLEGPLEVSGCGRCSPGTYAISCQKGGRNFLARSTLFDFLLRSPSPKVSILNASPSTFFSSAPHPPTSHTGRDTTDSTLIALPLTLELRQRSQAVCAFSYPVPPQIPFFLLQPSDSTLPHLRTSSYERRISLKSQVP